MQSRHPINHPNGIIVYLDSHYITKLCSLIFFQCRETIGSVKNNRKSVTRREKNGVFDIE